MGMLAIYYYYNIYPEFKDWYTRFKQTLTDFSNSPMTGADLNSLLDANYYLLDELEEWLIGLVERFGTMLKDNHVDKILIPENCDERAKGCDDNFMNWIHPKGPTTKMATL